MITEKEIISLKKNKINVITVKCYCCFLIFFINVNQTDHLPSRINLSICPELVPQDSHKYLSTYLVASVLPAPDSPETIID